MRRFHIHAILGFGLMMLVPAARAQDFDTYFDDRTLRIDYSFAGNARSQSIYVSDGPADGTTSTNCPWTATATSR